jgi:hypothetical protein
MPADSAVWRYRITDIDYLTQIFDNILFLNGQDTFANGNTYHKIISRTCKQTGPEDFDPPFVDVVANGPDFYYGAIRESGRKVFLLAGSGEQLIYDFTVAAGDSVPAYSGKDKVTAIDSVWLGGAYHKRYLTTDAGYSIIEGVGSSRGLIPGINDGGEMSFICLADSALTYSPDPALPCTYVYPAGYVAAVTNVNDQLPGIKVFPVPANDVLHITVTGVAILSAAIVNSVGQVIWNGEINEKKDIQVSSWPDGIYYVRFKDDKAGYIVNKFVVY